MMNKVKPVETLVLTSPNNNNQSQSQSQGQSQSQSSNNSGSYNFDDLYSANDHKNHSRMSDWWYYNSKSEITPVDLFFLAVSLVLGSLSELEFESGYWILLFNMLFTGFGYLLVCLCLAEMSSALPFSGGIYGLVRAFVHPLAGFYVAIFELMINIFYLAIQVRFIGTLLIQAVGISPAMIFVLFIAIYAFFLMICLLAGKIFWGLTDFLGFMCLLFIFIYILGNCPGASFSHWDHTTVPFTFVHFMNYLPGSNLTYLGIHYLPLSGKYMKEPKKIIPFVLLFTMILIFCMGIAVITVAFSIPPGYHVLAHAGHPLNFGFARVFRITKTLGHLFALPGIMAKCFSFMYCYGRQSISMAGSGIIPAIFQLSIPVFNTPYFALIFICILSFILNLIMNAFPISTVQFFSDIVCISTSVVLIFFFLAYIQFTRNFSSLERLVINPLGIPGACIGIMIFMFCLIAALGFRGSRYLSVVFLVVVTIGIIIVNQVFLKGMNKFSEEEKNELFKAYLINGK